MKLPDLRKALRADVIGPDCSEYEPENARFGIDDARSAVFQFASKEERQAAMLTRADLGKLAFQSDNSKFYIVIDIDTTERISKGTGIWQEVPT